jgi:uncharacterized small protein (DUF1192 family)
MSTTDEKMELKAINARLDSMEQLATLRHNQINQRIAVLIERLDLHNRIEKLEQAHQKAGTN